MDDMFKKGHKVSLEVRQKISAAQKTRPHQPHEGFQKGHTQLGGYRTRFKKGIPNNNGVKNPAWGIRGEKSWNWKGGLTPLMVQIRQCFEYRQWRSDVFTRDGFIYVNCGGKNTELNADHFPKTFASIIRENGVKSMDDALKCAELWNINNGRTLCVPCHKEHHHG